MYEKNSSAYLACVISLVFFMLQLIQADSIPVNSKDVESVDAIINSLYNVISGPAGEKRNWDRMRTLFIPEANMIATGKRNDGNMGKRVMTVENYITTSGPFLGERWFF